MKCENQPLISIIVPVYNVEKYLERCVKSIINQTYKRLEIILVDDGSLDSSPLICDMLSNKDKRIQVIHKENGGLSSARNAGIEIASGRYLGFVDSDDFIDKDMYSRLLESIKRYNADVAMVKYKEVDSDIYRGKINRVPELLFNGREVERAYLQLRIESVCVGIYARDAIGDIRFQIGKMSEDIPFNFEVFKRISSFVYVPEKRYFYYYNPNSISNGKLNKKMFDLLYFRKEIFDYYKMDSILSDSAEALYARSAMALLTRMAIFGVSEEVDIEKSKNQLQRIFREHKSSFFKSKEIQLSRKILGIVCLYSYQSLQLLGKIKK